jgi:hypothetical protein
MAEDDGLGATRARRIQSEGDERVLSAAKGRLQFKAAHAATPTYAHWPRPYFEIPVFDKR